MELNDAVLNRALFDSRTKGQWIRDWLDAFVCLGCGRLFISIPDAHDLLLDAEEPTRRMPFNTPSGTRCPMCHAEFQGEERMTRDASLDEIAESPWSWILRR